MGCRNFFSTREVPLDKYGGQSDGRGPQLHVLGSSASCVSPAGEHGKISLGRATRSSAALADASFTGARELAQAARELRRVTDPTHERQARCNGERQIQAAPKAAQAPESCTLAPSRNYHERAVAPRMTEKHRGSGTGRRPRSTTPSFTRTASAIPRPPSAARYARR